MRRSLILSSIILAGLGVWVHGAQQQAATPRPSAIDPGNFTGKVTDRSISDIRTLRYHFDPSARTN